MELIIYLTVRVLHVLFGAFWVGAAFLVVLYLEPSVREAGPAGGVVVRAMVRRGYSGFINLVGIVSLVTGFWLLWRMSGHFSGGFMGTTPGILISNGMLAGILAWGAGHGIRGSVKRLTVIGARVEASGAPPTAEDQAEMERLRNKARMYSRITAVLLLIAMVTMALGPHVA